MPVQSKAWDWGKSANPIWFAPCEESYYLLERWKRAGYVTFLDFGCGLGRHSIFFAQHGFDVSAFDLSAQGIAHVAEWAAKENVFVNARQADMLDIPFANASFDCLLAMHVISHTDTAGFERIMHEIRRILKPGAEFYITLCSKETWSFVDAGFPKLDDSTVIKTDDGPEDGIPHFYIDLDGILGALQKVGLEPIRIRHTDDCFWDGVMANSKHYFVLGRKSGA